jgi:hypothetical protein
VRAGSSPSQQANAHDWFPGLKILDVNGDGLKDVITWTPPSSSVDGPSQYLKLWINTGRNQFTGGNTIASLLSSADKQSLDAVLNAGTFKQAFAYDVNRDGLEDFAFLATSKAGPTALVAVPDEYKNVYGSDVGSVSDEYTYFHPDTLTSQTIGFAATEGSYLYNEAGRYWKRVVVNHGVTSGLGSAAKTVDHVVTEVRTLEALSSAGNTPFWVVSDVTTTESEADGQGNEQVLLTAEVNNSGYAFHAGRYCYQNTSGLETVV